MCIPQGNVHLQLIDLRKMAGVFVSMMITASLVMGCTNLVNAEAWKEELPPAVIHVRGTVMCQDCTMGWNQWLHGSKPIKGSKVSITCMDERSRVMHYGSDETDEKGEFEMIVNKYIYGKELKMEGCRVRLVSSPDPACNIATDFAGGKSGVKLGRPTSVYRDIIKHNLGTLFYTTPMCDKPDTTDSINGQGSNY